jgi:hypothetical protein
MIALRPALSPAGVKKPRQIIGTSANFPLFGSGAPLPIIPMRNEGCADSCRKAHGLLSVGFWGDGEIA